MTEAQSVPAPESTASPTEVNLSNTDENIINGSDASMFNEDGTPKSKNQLKNDAKKAAKMEKFLAKQSKVADMQKAGSNSKMKTLDKKGEVDEEVLKTPPGEKKDMSKPMADSYNPRAVEAAWYAWWEKSGFFKPEFGGDLESKEKFTMVVPPPNVTGSLHLGHTMMTAIEDSLARWHRMNGKAVLYLPGCDHAGIATQAVVEKKLKKERNLLRHDLGREAFVSEVWKWKEQYGHRIYDQLRRMGSSVDWERACFTLDPMANKAVNEAFCRMFDDGLIFRANRLVHWSGKLKTALSDLEVESREIEPRSFFPAHGHDPKKKYEFGVMTSIAYRIEGGEEGEEIVIATTRPETVFADVAIAVNPEDSRYTKYHGKYVIHPVTGGRIPIILDKCADPEFGTGALKISPAHDHTDFEVAQRHNLPFISVFDENNVLNEKCGQYSGLPRYDGRNAVIEHIKGNGTYRGDAPHAMVLPVCTRSGDFVEPRLMPQWWLNCKAMAEQSLDAVRTGELQIFPKESERDWFHWLENIRDWCLSRQLWWGHRVPAYRVEIVGTEKGVEGDVWVAARNQEEAMQKAQAKFPGVQIDCIRLHQDEDVLDTWFSSGLWPFSTLGWPDQTPDMRNFYPNTLLETGSDILFFWVARMVMMGLYLTGKLPFSQIFLHAIVRDAHGRKMSKSLGNVVDPIDVIEGVTLEHLHATLEQGNLDPAEVKTAKEGQKRDFPHGIPECGTDALRFALCSYVAGGRDVNMNITRVEAYRRFCNKLWNATKFALMKLGTDFIPDAKPLSAEELLASNFESAGKADLWIFAKLRRAADTCNRQFSAYNLANVATAIHQFWLYELCDVYIEAVKPVLSGDFADATARRRAQCILYDCLEEGLKLLHPMMPFLTEELYQRLPRRPGCSVPSICLASYPQLNGELPEALLTAESDFEAVFDLVKAIRSTAMDRKLPKSTQICLNPSTPSAASLIKSEELAIATFIKSVGALQLTADGEVLKGAEAVELMTEKEVVKSSVTFVTPATPTPN